MGMTIEQAMDKLLEFKKRTFKDDNISELSQALSIAFLTMQNYQLLKISYNDRLKDDMVAMLIDMQSEINECVDGGEGSPEFESGVTISRNQVLSMIEKRISELKEDTEKDMEINEAVAWIDKNIIGMRNWYLCISDVVALNTAMNIMRKYQKIEQVMDNRADDSPKSNSKALGDIEVIVYGNDD